MADVLASGPPHGVIDIEPLNEVEAIELIQACVPGLPIEEAEALNSVLGGKPLAIEQVCAYIAADELMTVEEFLRDVGNNAARALDIPGSARHTMTTTYARTIDVLRQMTAEHGDLNAVRLLELVAFLGTAPIPLFPLASAFLDSRPWIPNDYREHDPDFVRAIRILQGRKLIRHVDGAITLHSLTQSILRDLLADSSRRVCICLFNHFCKAIPSMRPGDILEANLLSEIQHALKILLGLRDISPKQAHSMNFAQLSTTVLRGLRQAGDSKGLIKLIGHIGREWPFDEASSAEQIQLSVVVWEEMYTSGYIAADEYARRLLSALDYQPTTSLLAKLVPGHRALRALAMSLLRDYEDLDRYANEFGSSIGSLLANRAETHASAGDFMLLIGDTAMERGLLMQARRWYSMTNGQYQSATDPHRARGILKLSLRIAELFALHGDLEGALPVLAVHDEALQESGVVDSLMEANFFHIRARLMSRFHLLTGQRITNGDEDAAEELFDKAAKSYQAYGANQFVSDVGYDRICDAIIRRYPREAIEEMLEAVEAAAVYYKHELEVRRFRLLRIKYDLLLGRSRPEHISRCLQLAYRFAATFSCLRCYSDALVTALAISHTSGDYSQLGRTLWPHIVDAYQEIGSQFLAELVEQIRNDDYHPIHLLAL